MKVRELIEKLQQMPLDAECVIIECDSFNGTSEEREVYPEISIDDSKIFL